MIMDDSPKPGSIGEAHSPVAIPGAIPTLHPEDILPASSFSCAYLLCSVLRVLPVELGQRCYAG